MTAADHIALIERHGLRLSENDLFHKESHPPGKPGARLPFGKSLPEATVELQKQIAREAKSAYTGYGSKATVNKRLAEKHGVCAGTIKNWVLKYIEGKIR